MKRNKTQQTIVFQHESPTSGSPRRFASQLFQSSRQLGIWAFFKTKRSPLPPPGPYRKPVFSYVCLIDLRGGGPVNSGGTTTATSTTAAFFHLFWGQYWITGFETEFWDMLIWVSLLVLVTFTRWSKYGSATLTSCTQFEPRQGSCGGFDAFC